MLNYIIIYLAIGLCMSLIKVANYSESEMQRRGEVNKLDVALMFPHMTLLWLPHFIAMIFYCLEQLLIKLGGE